METKPKLMEANPDFEYTRHGVEGHLWSEFCDAFPPCQPVPVPDPAKVGPCSTLPNGDCVAEGCMHTKEPPKMEPFMDAEKVPTPFFEAFGPIPLPSSLYAAARNAWKIAADLANTRASKIIEERDEARKEAEEYLHDLSCETVISNRVIRERDDFQSRLYMLEALHSTVPKKPEAKEGELNEKLKDPSYRLRVDLAGLAIKADDLRDDIEDIYRRLKGEGGKP